MGAAGTPVGAWGCGLATVTPEMSGPGGSVRDSRGPGWPPPPSVARPAWPGCPGLPRDGQDRPSVRSGWVGSGVAGGFGAPGPQHGEGLRGAVRHAVAEARDGEHSRRRGSARLPPDLPSGSNVALSAQAPTSRPLAPTRHEQSSSGAALEGTQPWRAARFPKARGHAPLEQLDSRPRSLNCKWLRACQTPTWGHTTGRCLPALLQSSKGGPRENLAQSAQPASTRTPWTAQDRWLAPQWARGTKARG